MVRNFRKRMLFEALEPRLALDGNSLVISEFLAVNNHVLPDEDGNFSDWIEIHNPTPNAVNLDHWFLTDSARDLTKWEFPNVTLPAGGYQLVFASDKDRSDPAGELHANFKLAASGEYLALVRPDGTTVEFAYTPQFPPQSADISYGLAADLSTQGYFPQPTPGKANTSDPLGDASRLIVINEIMYHPGFGEYGEPGHVPEDTRKEYIELFNPNDVPVSLLNWRIADGVDYTFGDVTLAPGKYMVVAADVATFNSTYTVPPETLVVGGWSGQLNNNGERIQIVDDIGAVVDEVRYSDEGEWAIRQRPFPQQTVSGITLGGTTATVTLPAHGYVNGDRIRILGADQPEYNGVFKIANATQNTFTYAVSGAPASPATGTIMAQKTDWGHLGWVWSSGANAGGKSLELVNPAMSNEYGQNWGDSLMDGGTPGVANSIAAANIAPVVLDVAHLPAIPRSSDPVTVTARAIDELTNGVTMTLSYRTDGTPSFTTVPMVDDGQHDDQGAGDGLFGATIPAMADRTVVEFYVSASDGTGHARSWPAPNQPAGEHLTNLLYQVDNSFDPNAAWAPGSQPIYRLIMTDAERLDLRDIGANDGDADQWSNAQMNGTFITIDGTGMAVQYQVGIANRGHGTRRSFEGNANNYKIFIPHDENWKGLSKADINYNFTDSQAIGSAVYQMAGLTAPEETPIQLRINGANLAVPGARMFNTYAEKEDYNSEFAAEHFPEDPDGNLYVVHYAFDENNNILDQGNLRYEGTNPDNYRDCYLKQTNSSENDYSDLIHLVDVLNRAPDATFLQEISQVIDVNEWLRFIAADSIMVNLEGGLATGLGDDYGLYRGVQDQRFRLVPWDMDTLLGLGDGGSHPTRGIFGGYTNIPGLSRLLTHPDTVGLYYTQLLDLVNTTFVPQNFNPLVDQVLGDWVPKATIDAIKRFVVDRAASVLAQIPQAFAITSTLPVTNGFAYTNSAATSLSGTANAALTRSVLVNGQAAQWNATAGTWSAASVALNPGINRVVVEAFDGPNGTGKIVQQGFLDVHYDDQSMVTVTGVLGANTSWDAAAGPYHVTGNVTVPAGVTLTIEPGTTVFFDASTSITVNGRIVAEGTPYQQIRFTRVPGGGTYNGLQLLNTMADNRIVYAVLEYGRTNNGNLGVENSNLLVDHATFDNTDLRRIRTIDSALIVRNSTFTDIFPGTTPPTTDNMSEHIWGRTRLDSGDFIIENNVFGTTKGHNDAFDVDGADRPGPVMQIRNNVFMGGGDDAMDLEGDALVEGNIVMHIKKDQWNLGSGNSNGISAGAGHTYTVVRNVFYDGDTVAQVKDGSYMTFVNNTAMTMRMAGLYFLRPGGTSQPGRGAYVDGNIFVDVATAFDDFTATTDLVVNRTIVPAAFHSYGVGNIDADPRLADPAGGDFSLLPGSPAFGAGPNGWDMGYLVPDGASIAGEPPAVTNQTSATLTVMGPAITHYKYRVNDGPWSAELPVATPIQLSGLADGTYTVSVIGEDFAYVWQSEAQATVSKSWTVDTSAAHLRINEVLAINATAVNNGGAFPDVIELMNDGATTINLAGMSISDNPLDPDKFVFPAGTTLAPGQYLVLYGDNETAATGLHLGFALDGHGDGVYLFDAPAHGGTLLDSIEFGLQIADLSIGRVGHDGQWALTQPTFGAANVAARTGDPATLRINEWFTSGEIRLTDDFIELYSPDPLPVDLGGLYLTDHPEILPHAMYLNQQNPALPAPRAIPPLSFIAGAGPYGAWAVFAADGKPARGADHLDFKLSSMRGMIGLFDKDLKLIDQILYGTQTTDVSQGRTPLAATTYAFQTIPTPGIENTGVTRGVPQQPQTTRLIGISDSEADKWRYYQPYPQPYVSLGTAWRETTYVETPDWLTGSAVFYNETQNLAEPQRTLLNDQGATPYPTYYFRKHFNFSGDISKTTLALRAILDDGAMIYLNGHQALGIGFTLGTEVNFTDLSSRRVSGAATYGDWTIPTTYLVQGDNLLAVEVHQGAATSSDITWGATLDAVIGGGETIIRQVDLPPNIAALVNGLRVTELMYNPQGDADAEFIELRNTGAEAIDLSGVRLGGGIDFTFPPMWLPAGKDVVVVRDLEAFAARYGAGVNVAGQYSGVLSDGGEELVLQLPAPFEAAVGRFTYDDAWYPTTDGAGYALVVRDPAAPVASWSSAANWQAGAGVGGSPGRADGQPLAPSIVVNEVLTHTDDPQVDAIELFNPTADPVNIGGWFLSDSADNFRKFRIPDGTTIGSGQYLVFYQGHYVDHVMQFAANEFGGGANGFGLNSYDGDDVWLTATDATGNVIQVVDFVKFGPAANGETFGRWPNGSGLLYPMIVPTLDPANGANSGPRVGPLVISEINYNSGNVPNAADLEFVEISNPTALPVDLTRWRLRKGIDFDFPAGTVLGAGSTLVVVSFDPATAAQQLAAFRTHYGLGPAVRIVGPYTGSLSDGGEKIELWRPDMPPPEDPSVYPGLLEDQVVYDDAAPWPTTADGGGDSLQRTAANLWGNAAASWTAAVPTPGATPWQGPAQVTGRRIFYNHSTFDLRSAAANEYDDAAIAPDKTALLPGQTATFANYTSYSRGINGIMLDLAQLPAKGTVDAADFGFRVGNSDTPGAWAAAPAPTSVTVRAGGGAAGTTRVTIIWPDGAIRNQWLQVTAQANADTGLAAADVFYFGNAVGETGNSLTDARVDAVDMLLSRSNPRSFTNPAPIDFHYDFDRDGRVNATDVLLARNNQTSSATALRLISVPGGKGAKTARAAKTAADPAAVYGALGWTSQDAADAKTVSPKRLRWAVDRVLTEY